MSPAKSQLCAGVPELCVPESENEIEPPDGAMVFCNAASEAVVCFSADNGTMSWNDHCNCNGFVWSDGNVIPVKFAPEIPTPATNLTTSSRLLSTPEPTVTLKIA